MRRPRRAETALSAAGLLAAAPLVAVLLALACFAGPATGAEQTAGPSPAVPVTAPESPPPESPPPESRPSVAKAKAPPTVRASSAAAAPARKGEASSGGGIDFADQKSGTPLEVYADQGLELSQDAKTVIGRGNAKAIRGKVTITADVLTAHYRDKVGGASSPVQTPFTDLPPAAPVAGQAAGTGKAPAPGPAKAAADGEAAPGAASAGPGGHKDGKDSENGTEVWRVQADGHVSIAGETQTAYGDHADYNIDDAVVVMTGQDLKMLTPTDVVTARDTLEYWERRQQAVARGNAVAVRGEKRIQADVLVADFARNADRQMAMQRAHAYNHVILTSPREVVTGDRGDYNVETGIVIMSGSVKITRDDNQLDGGYAVVNLNTGVSRIYPVAPGATPSTDRRVKGLFVPQKRPSESQAPAASSPPSNPDPAAAGPATGARGQ